MDVSEVKNAPLPTLEHMLGKGCLMPFNCANSGVRKLMFGTNLEQRLNVEGCNVPFLSTGFENQFGEYSSSYEKLEKDYTVLSKIEKFKNKPFDHYYLIIASGNELDMVERISYKHITESYGYIYNNELLDSLSVGSKLKSGSVIRKSKAFDDYDNRMDGRNLLLLFNSSEYTMEDAIIISESCSKQLASKLIHKIRINIGSNQIPLNMYGNDYIYKIFPDIGEEIQHGILCVLRTERKEESLYSQSFDRLSIPTVSDEKIVVSGKVVDIDIRCNDPEALMDNPYCEQIKEYYLEHISFCEDFVKTVKFFEDKNYTMTNRLKELYHNCQAELDGKKFFNEKVFSNMIIDIAVMEEIPVKVGDKITNRYGGKGVVSLVKPDHLMPKTFDGRTIDINANICGVYNRENPGQLFEMSLNFISNQLAKAMGDDVTTTAEAVEMYLDYLALVSPSMHDEAERFFAMLTDEEISEYISTISREEMLYLVADPISEIMTIDKLKKIYDRFPWIQQEHVLVPIHDSVGNLRYVKSNRPVVCGEVYYYRLKQYGKEKFSITSLSATNIKNENSRNKASKVYKSRYARTPIRFGDMEVGNLSHMGADLVSQILMLYATSPEGRMLCESMMTDDPFNVDVTLNDDSSNRNVEIFNTYMKTIGLRILFNKIPKKKFYPTQISPIVFDYVPRKEIPFNPIFNFGPDLELTPDLKRGMDPNYKPPFYPIRITPIKFFKDPREIHKEREESLEAERLALEEENK